MEEIGIVNNVDSSENEITLQENTLEYIRKDDVLLFVYNPNIEMRLDTLR